MKTENESSISGVIGYIANLEADNHRNLSKLVASLCDIDEDTLFSKSDEQHIAHARWLYWYSYRYMTKESYIKMSIHTSRYGRNFSLRTIQHGVNQMSMMIEYEPIWKKRWILMRKVIKPDGEDGCDKDCTIVINVPKHMKDKVKFEIKEK